MVVHLYYVLVDKQTLSVQESIIWLQHSGSQFVLIQTLQTLQRHLTLNLVSLCSQEKGLIPEGLLMSFSTSLLLYLNTCTLYFVLERLAKI